MRTGRILDWRRTRQQVVQQKFALRAKARFNPFRDSAGCTIAMRWQRRLKSNSSEDQTLLQPGRGTVHIFLRASLTGRRFTAIPNRKAYANEKQILLMFCTRIWRTTGLSCFDSASKVKSRRPRTPFSPTKLGNCRATARRRANVALQKADRGYSALRAVKPRRHRWQDAGARIKTGRSRKRLCDSSDGLTEGKSAGTSCFARNT